VKAGDVFRFPGIADKHVWMIISDPARGAGRVLIVNFTSRAPHIDNACPVSPGDHPFISCETLINYARARMVSDAALEALFASKKLELLDPLTPELLKKIREGAMESITLALEFADLLLDQELVE
jgi:hypothetical protein